MAVFLFSPVFSAFQPSADKALLARFPQLKGMIEWQQPGDLSHGDLTTSAAMRVAKGLKRPPREVAEEMVEVLRDMPEVMKAEAAGPGFVNVYLRHDVLLAALQSSADACVAKKPAKKDAPVIVEYSCPNIAKPLGVHHLLSTLIGQSIANIYEHQGYNTIKWNYLGDWGTQFGKLAVAVEKWGDGRKVSAYTMDDLLELYVRFHDEAEKDPSLEDLAREKFRLLEEGDKELKAFWKEVVELTKQSLQGLYERLHVAFDIDLGESFYGDKMDAVLEEGKKKQVFVEGKEGAWIVEFPEESKMPPYLVRKGDGATLYSTRDITQMRYRIDTYHPQEILIVTDIAQKLHFEQLVETCKQLQWELPAFENVLVGRMSFADSKMSTRKGNILKLDAVLQEAVDRAAKLIAERGESIQTDDGEELAEMMGIGAVAYGIVSQNRTSNMIFSWEKMLSFEGNSAPYVQYTYARARSVLRKAEIENVAMPKGEITLSEHERTLVLHLVRIPAVLEHARSEHMPHALAQYVYELCQVYNAFYNVESILQAPEPARSLRLSLTDLTSRILFCGANLLTLRLPERM